MTIKSNALRPAETSERPPSRDAVATIPSPAQVRAAAAEIRRSWTPDQRRRRARLACYMIWHQVLGRAEALDSPADLADPFTPRRFPPRS